ncbi:DUF3124 domain-containing protein [Psychrobacter sp. I-STPA10]|uniref:DUF3124 domain-containing protein n=1 Tax=Psychrobacter sp. I-STPA10 TaxID=2585769 RepID=UPI001E58B69B|nr:DUF3124 domain-containing protein [Psychrobacter sp. I-STPA10]
MRLTPIVFIALCTAVGSLTGCEKPSHNPNILYSENHEDPIKQLETETVIADRDFAYKQTFYVPIYSDIYVDEDNTKVLLSATLSIRNTSLIDSLYVTKIDYYNTKGDFVRPYLDKSIELPPMGTLNYIVEKMDDTGGSGANFVVNIEADKDDTPPMIEAIMVGSFSNKGLAFKTDAVPIPNPSLKPAQSTNTSSN